MSRTPSQGAGTPTGTAGGAKPLPHKPTAAARPAPPAAGVSASASAAPPAAPARAGTPTATPAAPAKAKPGVGDYLKRPEVVKYGSAALGLVLLVALFMWRPWSPRPPRLNDDPAAIAKYAASNIHKLPFEHQRQYMELLDEKDDRVDEAYEQGTLSDQEFRRVLQLAWYGEQLKKMDNFFSKPPSLRLMYLDKQVDKRQKKKAKNKNAPEPDAKAPLKAEEIERDDSTEEQDVKRWPSDVRQRWTEYRTAWSNRKQFWKDQKDQIKASQETAAKAKAGGAGGATPEGRPGPVDTTSDPKGAEAAASTGGGTGGTR